MNYFINFIKKILISLGILFIILDINYFGIESKLTNKELIHELITKVNISSLDETVFGVQIGANNPCEDKFFIYPLKLSDRSGIFMSIFDGHGGQILSEYANLVLYPYFIEEYNKTKNNISLSEDDRIVHGLKTAYARIEDEFQVFGFLKYVSNNKKYTHYGSCALSVIVINNKIYTAVLGDSKARLFISDSDNEKNYKYKKLTKVYNMRKKDQQEKYKQKWSDDPDIFVCHHPKSCYVKGALQPTTALGDYTLKTVLFQFPITRINDTTSLDKAINSFKGPYVDSVPDIQIYELTKKDKFLIMGSDGLWDDLNSKKISKMIPDFIEDKDNDLGVNDIKSNSAKISYSLLQKVLTISSNDNKMEIEKVLKMEKGRRLRRIHDDITIITCDLSKIKF